MPHEEFGNEFELAKYRLSVAKRTWKLRWTT